MCCRTLRKMDLRSRINIRMVESEESETRCIASNSSGRITRFCQLSVHLTMKRDKLPAAGRVMDLHRRRKLIPTISNAQNTGKRVSFKDYSNVVKSIVGWAKSMSAHAFHRPLWCRNDNAPTDIQIRGMQNVLKYAVAGVMDGKFRNGWRKATLQNRCKINPITKVFQNIKTDCSMCVQKYHGLEVSKVHLKTTFVVAIVKKRGGHPKKVRLSA